MNRTTDRNAERAEALQQRLSELIEEHSQADIARKTETSRNNVSRYANGTRMPLEFGTALVEGLGVNPAWLLTGEGTPYLSDVSADTQKMAGDLLALVDAMGAVNRMRLGALTGKHHLKVLRELNDTLKNYEETRAKLNTHSRPIFLKLIEEIRESLLKQDINRAEGLLSAAEQVSRLSDDLFLQAQLEGAQSHFHHSCADPEKAIPHQRRSFLSFLVKHSKFDEWMKPEAHNYVMVLTAAHRLPEARRVARASRELFEGEHPELSVMASALDLELGDLHRGLSELRRLIPLVEPRYAHNAEHTIARGQLLERSMRMEQALTWGRKDVAQWSRLLTTAVVFEDATDLSMAIEYAVGDEPGQLDREEGLAVHAACLLDALKGEDDSGAQQLLVHLENTKQKQDAMAQFEQQCWVAQLFRVLGDRKQALSHLQKAQELLDAMPEGLLPRIEYRILHARNTLELIKPTEKKEERKQLRQWAEAFVSEYHSKGYHCLKELAEQLDS